MWSRSSLPRFLIALGLLLFLGQIAPAQDPYPQTVRPGARWTIEIGIGMGDVLLYQETITCDTAWIAGERYHLVEVATVQGPDGKCGTGGYVREDTIAQQVFFRPNDDPSEDEILLIDYSLGIGDTFTSSTGFVFTVDTIRMVPFLGDTVRFIDFGFQAQDGFLLGYGRLSSGIMPNCEGWSHISDYEQLDVNCDETSTTDPEAASAIILSPNPAGSVLTIQRPLDQVGEPLGLEIRSLTGNLLLQQQVRGDRVEIPIGHLPAGMLVVTLQSASGTTTQTVLHF